MTLAEESARAQSLGVPMGAYRAMPPAERRAGASYVGAEYGRRGEDDLLALLTSLMGQQGAGDRQSWVSVWQQAAAEEAAATAAYQRARQVLGIEQAFGRETAGLGLERRGEQSRLGRELERELQRMQQAAGREQRGREMEASGQAGMIDIFGRDPARSLLFELGAMGGGYGEMPPL